jgi:hypothetical protein
MATASALSIPMSRSGRDTGGVADVGEARRFPVCLPTVEARHGGRRGDRRAKRLARRRLSAAMRARRHPAQHGVLEMARLIFDGDMLVAEPAPHRDDLSQCICRVGQHRARWHDRAVFSDQLDNEAIVLRQHTARTVAALFGWIRRTEKPAASKARTTHHAHSHRQAELSAHLLRSQLGYPRGGAAACEAAASRGHQRRGRRGVRAHRLQPEGRPRSRPR